jgi:dTDP-4-amino-4,6-dideoxygalactose transaminase
LCLGPGNFPVTEWAADHILSLPMYPELTDRQIGHVVEAVKHAVNQSLEV